jgi:hypothetical protein
VTPEVLAHDGLIRDTKLPVKILGAGDAPKGVTIHAHAFSKTAREKLEAAGSTLQLLSWPDNAPIDERPAKPEGKRSARRRVAIERAARVDAGGDAAPAAAEPTKKQKAAAAAAEAEAARTDSPAAAADEPPAEDAADTDQSESES